MVDLSTLDLDLGGRPYQLFPWMVGHHELALGHFGGDWQHNVLYLAGCILIQNKKLSLSRHHFIVRLSHHGGDVVTVETGAVDYILSFNLSRCCEDPLDFPLFRFNAGYLSFQPGITPLAQAFSA